MWWAASSSARRFDWPFPAITSRPSSRGDNVQFTVSQVTRGSMNYARKGDYAFLLPRAINPRGLSVSQLVLYKSIPFRQFNPAATGERHAEGEKVSLDLSSARKVR